MDDYTATIFFPGTGTFGSKKKTPFFMIKWQQ